MKKIIPFLTLLTICVFLTSCSLVESIILKIPFFEEADISSLTGKAEKAWEEVGKDALKDAAQNATDAIFGEKEELLWPANGVAEGIPEVTFGTIEKIEEIGSVTIITVYGVSLEKYEKYVSSLNDDLGLPNSEKVYRFENRLVSTSYDSENTRMKITISIIKTSTSDFESTENTESDISSEVSAVGDEETSSIENSF